MVEQGGFVCHPVQRSETISVSIMEDHKFCDLTPISLTRLFELDEMKLPIGILLDEHPYDSIKFKPNSTPTEFEYKLPTDYPDLHTYQEKKMGASDELVLSLKAKIEVLSADNKSLKEQLNIISLENKKLKEDNKKLNERIDLLSADNKSLKEQLNTISLKSNKLEESNKKLNEQMVGISAENKDLNEELKIDKQFTVRNVTDHIRNTCDKEYIDLYNFLLEHQDNNNVAKLVSVMKPYRNYLANTYKLNERMLELAGIDEETIQILKNGCNREEKCKAPTFLEDYFNEKFADYLKETYE